MFICKLSLSLLTLSLMKVNGIQRFGTRKEGLYSLSEGTLLKGHVIQEYLLTSPLVCSLYCTSNDQCLSYNYKPRGDGVKDICELNDASRKTNPASYVVDEQYDHYYDVETENSRSCLDYLRRGSKENGIYTITDSSGDSYKVWCDISSEPGSAWTLILSFALKYKYAKSFCKNSLAQNSPFHNESPNWQLYRLSLNRMQSLSSQATHWRATTSFINYGVDYTDYVRGNFSTFDVMTYEGYGDCKDIEYINIRGTHGTHTQASFWQKRDLNLLNVYSCSPACAFKAVNCTSTESSFGSYCEASNSANPRFRGTINDNSTTEWWFGGYL